MKLNVLGMILLFLIIVIIPLSSQQKDTAYDYPVKPGTDQWKALTSHEEMIKVSVQVQMKLPQKACH